MGEQTHVTRRSKTFNINFIFLLYFPAQCSHFVCPRPVFTFLYKLQQFLAAARDFPPISYYTFVNKIFKADDEKREVVALII